MQKFLSMMLLGLATAGAAQAQQLANGGFEGDWEECYPWEKGANVTKAYGTQPTGWIVSNVPNSMLKNYLAASTEGKNDNGVKLINQSVLGNNIPAYIGLGTTWATAETKGTSTRNKDGGSFGGITFSCKPDAVSLDFKRDVQKSGDKFTIVAYLWKGTWTQADVPSNTAVGLIASWGTATKVTMTDRDVNILGKTSALGGTVTKTEDAELIASLEKVSESQASVWTTMEVPFEYKNANATPQKMNIIIANNDYFDATSIVSGSELSIDNVQLVYWNKLSSLKYDNVELLDGNQTSYDLSSVVYDAAKLEATTKSQFANADVSYNDATAIATITVTRENAENKTYTIQFKVPSNKQIVDKITYPKTIVVTINDESAAPQASDIDVTYYDDSTIDFTLKNFILGEGDDSMPVGNIALEELEMDADGKFSYNGGLYISAGDKEGIAEDQWFGPMLGQIVGPLPLDLTGEIADDGFFYVNIDLDLTEVLGQVVNVQAGDPVPATLTISAAKASTFVAPFKVTIPTIYDDVTQEDIPCFTAYTIDGENNGVLNLVDCEGTIPAKTPVVIEGDEAEYYFAIVKTRDYVTPAPSTVGLLTGVYENTTAPASSYVLQKQDSRVGFYLVDDVQPTVKANRCYLTLPADSQPRALYFGDDLATAINSAVTTTVSSEIFDLQGRRINSASQKGVFIANGKKIVK